MKVLNKYIKQILIDVIELVDPPNPNKVGRPKKCSIDEYLEIIFHTLVNGTKWEYVKSKVSGSMCSKMFRKWSNLGVFNITYNIIANIYHQTEPNSSDYFIDSSHIKNWLGNDNIGKNHYDRYRNSTKIHVMIDDKGAPLSIDFSGGNIHDVTKMEDTVNKAPVKITRGTFLIGDSGYKGAKQAHKLYQKYGLKVITPDKKNQIHNLNNTTEIEKLKKRHLSENCFAWLKTYNKLKIRTEKKSKYFESFVLLAASCIIDKKRTI